MPDDNETWDIYPSSVHIELMDASGNNLLDLEVNGNLVGESMRIEWNEKAYDAIWEKDDLKIQTRALMTYFYGTIWSGIWSNSHYDLYFGEFSGTSTQDLKLTFGIAKLNIEYDFEFSHRLVWKNKEPHFDDHITYNGKQIEGNTLHW